MSILIIVESPSKAKSIEAMLGSGYKVAASLGHIRDLPQKRMGLSEDGRYTPQYELTTTGKKAVSYIKDLAKKSSEIYLAADPDREGEAIAWHVAQVLKLKNPKRITYNEVTKQAILNALNNARSIDMKMVHAQEARRTVDRLVGYRVSPVLSSALKENTSAGRVQTPALFLIVKREAEIQQFSSTKHFGAIAFFPNFKASWDKSNFLSEGSKYILDRKIAEAVTRLDAFTVINFEETTSKQSPPAPFITSTLQRAGEKKLGIGVKEVMSLAQKLFEQGKITYMRTDSPVLSDEFISAAIQYCKENELPFTTEKRKYKSKDSAQEAHEAIRPTDITVKDAGENELEKQLYTLIRERALACVMPNAEFSVRSLRLKADLIAGENKPATGIFFEAKGKVKTVPGYTILFESAAENEEDPEQELNNQLPAFELGQKLKADNITVTEHATTPPKRFTQSSLVAELERQEIGRPATYASILDTLFTSSFAVEKNKSILPTKLGINIIQTLSGRFSFVDLQFTKALEKLLDNIAEGENEYLDIVNAMDKRLDSELQQFSNAFSLETCPSCGSNLVYSNGTYFCNNSNCNTKNSCPFCGDSTKYVKTQKGIFFFCSHNKDKKCKGGYKVDGSNLIAFTKKE